MKYYKWLILLIPTLFLTCNLANAAPNKGVSAEEFESVKSNVENMGFSKIELKDDQLTFDIDQEKLLGNIPELAKNDSNINVSAEDIKKYPFAVSIYVAAISFSTTMLTGYYAKDPKLDKVHVSVYFIPKDAKDKKLCYSFDYTRALYDALDLDKMTPNEFIENTPKFAFSDWCKEHLDKEDAALRAEREKQ